MSLKIQNSRQLLKRSTTSGATPSVFTGSTDYTDGTWGVNDIYAGEFYWNMADRKLFLGYETTGGTGVDLIYPQGSSSASCLTDLYVSNLYGCSPITLWDNITMQTGVTLNSADGFAYIGVDFGGTGEITLEYNALEQSILSLGSTGISLYLADGGSNLAQHQITPNNFQLEYPNNSNLFYFVDGTSLGSPNLYARTEGNIEFYSHFNDAQNSIILQPSATTIGSLQVQLQSNDGSVQTSYDQTPTIIQIKVQDNSVAQYANKIAVDAVAANMHAEDMTNGYVADISVSLTNPQSVMYAGDGVNDVTFTIKPTIANLTNVPAFADDAAASGLTTGDIYQTDGTGANPLDVPGILMIKQ